MGCETRALARSESLADQLSERPLQPPAAGASTSDQPRRLSRSDLAEMPANAAWSREKVPPPLARRRGGWSPQKSTGSTVSISRASLEPRWCRVPPILARCHPSTTGRPQAFPSQLPGGLVHHQRTHPVNAGRAATPALHLANTPLGHLRTRAGMPFVLISSTHPRAISGQVHPGRANSVGTSSIRACCTPARRHAVQLALRASSLMAAQGSSRPVPRRRGDQR